MGFYSDILFDFFGFVRDQKNDSILKQSTMPITTRNQDSCIAQAMLTVEGILPEKVELDR